MLGRLLGDENATVESLFLPSVGDTLVPGDGPKANDGSMVGSVHLSQSSSWLSWVAFGVLCKAPKYCC